MTIVALPSFPVKIQQLFEQHGITVKAAKDSYIFREGEQADMVFFVMTGVVQICKDAESGKEMTMRICGPQTLIGESTLYCRHQLHSTTAKTIEASVLIGLHTDTLEMLLNEHPSAMIDYLQWIQIENLKNQTRIRDLLLNGKKGALYSTLIRLSNTYGKKREDGSIFIQLALTNTDVANLCATSRELINRMLNDLKKLGVIEFDKGYITILDLAYLKREIACENCPLSICQID